MRTVSDDVMIDVLKLINSIDDQDDRSKAEEIKNDDQQKVEGPRGEDDGRDQVDPTSGTWLRLFGVAETHVRDVRFTPESRHSPR
jgi:hypothetical protein